MANRKSDEEAREPAGDPAAAVELLAQPREEPMSHLRRIALTLSVAALVSLPTASTALAGISLNGID